MYIFIQWGEINCVFVVQLNVTSLSVFFLKEKECDIGGGREFAGT